MAYEILEDVACSLHTLERIWRNIRIHCIIKMMCTIQFQATHCVLQTQNRPNDVPAALLTPGLFFEHFERTQGLPEKKLKVHSGQKTQESGVNLGF